MHTHKLNLSFSWWQVSSSNRKFIHETDYTSTSDSPSVVNGTSLDIASALECSADFDTQSYIGKLAKSGNHRCILAAAGMGTLVFCPNMVPNGL